MTRVQGYWYAKLALFLAGAAMLSLLAGIIYVGQKLRKTYRD